MQEKYWSTLKKYVERVVENEKPLGIILFGSLAKEEAIAESDIDVVVIYGHEIDFKEKSLVLRELDDSCLIEPFPYSYAQVERMLIQHNPFMFEVFTDGIVLYERNDKISKLFKLKERIFREFRIERVDGGWNIEAKA